MTRLMKYIGKSLGVYITFILGVISTAVVLMFVGFWVHLICAGFMFGWRAFPY